MPLLRIAPSTGVAKKGDKRKFSFNLSNLTTTDLTDPTVAADIATAIAAAEPATKKATTSRAKSSKPRPQPVLIQPTAPLIEEEEPASRIVEPLVDAPVDAHLDASVAVECTEAKGGWKTLPVGPYGVVSMGKKPVTFRVAIDLSKTSTPVQLDISMNKKPVLTSMVLEPSRCGALQLLERGDTDESFEWNFVRPDVDGVAVDADTVITIAYFPVRDLPLDVNDDALFVESKQPASADTLGPIAVAAAAGLPPPVVPNDYSTCETGATPAPSAVDVKAAYAGMERALALSRREALHLASSKPHQAMRSKARSLLADINRVPVASVSEMVPTSYQEAQQQRQHQQLAAAPAPSPSTDGAFYMPSTDGAFYMPSAEPSCESWMPTASAAVAEEVGVIERGKPTGVTFLTCPPTQPIGPTKIVTLTLRV